MGKYIRRDMFNRNVDFTRLYFDGKVTKDIASQYHVSEGTAVEGLHRVLRTLTQWANQQETSIPYTKEKYPKAFSFHSPHLDGFSPTELSMEELLEHKQFWLDQLEAYQRHNAGVAAV